MRSVWRRARDTRAPAADLSMLLGALFLIVVGAGPWSFDARAMRKRRA